MKEKILWLKFVVVILASGIALAGCAAVEKSNAQDT
jgi:hypothetical protein